MTDKQYAIKQLAIVSAFITCMYFCFAYDSGAAGIGAFISFWCVGQNP